VHSKVHDGALSHVRQGVQVKATILQGRPIRVRQLCKILEREQVHLELEQGNLVFDSSVARSAAPTNDYAERQCGTLRFLLSILALALFVCFYFFKINVAHCQAVDGQLQVHLLRAQALNFLLLFLLLLLGLLRHNLRFALFLFDLRWLLTALSVLHLQPWCLQK
jgi:hypothetical protein